MRSIILAATLGATLAAAGATPAAAQSCNAVDQARSALDARDVSAARAVAGAVPWRCEREVEDQVKRLAARTLHMAYLSGDPSHGFSEELLVEAGQMSFYWRVHTTLANIYRRRGQYNQAGCALQRALIDFEAAGLVWRHQDPYPGNARIAQISALADEMSLVLGRAPECPNARAFCRLDRNGRRTKVLPILFYNNSVNMTPDGEVAAAELAACLTQTAYQNVSEVVIYGHASRSGGERYNCRLSTRRANTIVNFLRRQSVPHRMIAIGRGEEEPYTPVQGGRYDDATLESMRRRVEVDVLDPRRSTRKKPQCAQ